MKPKFVSSLYTYYITIQSRAALSILWGKLSGHINAKLRLASNVGYLLKTILFSGGSMQTLANFKPSKASLIVAEFPQLKPNWLLMLGSQSVHRERCSERFPPDWDCLQRWEIATHHWKIVQSGDGSSMSYYKHQWYHSCEPCRNLREIYKFTAPSMMMTNEEAGHILASIERLCKSRSDWWRLQSRAPGTTAV